MISLAMLVYDRSDIINRYEVNVLGSMVASERLWRVDELAQFLRVSKQTLFSWISDGKLSATKLPSGAYRVTQAEVDRVLGREQDS